MNGKDRLFVALGIIGLIAAALLTSFGRNLFYLNIPSVVLPDVSTSNNPLHTEADWEGDSIGHSPVVVSVDSVQSVVDSLQRTDSYFQELTVELFWTEGSSATTVSVWRDGDWIATQQKLPSGLVRYDLVGEDTRYYWYDNSTQWRSAPADSNAGDLSQHIPTYEDVVDLDAQSIVAASYQLYQGHATIYVETETEMGCQRFWISTETGLLLAAEAEENDTLIYRLTAEGPLQTPCPSTAPFALPNGTSVDDL